MGTYKVIQDIEAEDKLLGPLTLRQFVYAAIVVVTGFIAFKLGQAKWFLAVPFLPPILFFGMLAAPFGHDQSNEVWLLAKIRFFLKPRRRIWNQSGIKELVTITVPKLIERPLTKGFSQEEVRSRLSALANTIDSRGWAVKNVSVNMFSQPSYVLSQAGSDRLIDPSMMPQEVPSFDVSAVDDMMDTQTSATAHHIDEMITASTQAHHQQLVAQMQRHTDPQQTQEQPPNYWFLNQPDPSAIPAGSAMFASPTVMPGMLLTDDSKKTEPTADETALLDRIKTEKAMPEPSYHHLKKIEPLGRPPANPPVTAPALDDDSSQKTTATPVDPAILELAHRDDLNVATLARQANKQSNQSPDEVVVSLH